MPCGLCTSGWYGIKREGESAMSEIRLSDSEYRLIAAVWEDEPVNSTELVRRCEKKYGWKKSTTYTVLRKICANDIFQNENTVVTSRMNREEYTRQKGERYLKENYGGSLPGFVAAFLKKKKLDKKEIEKLAQMIEDYKNGE